VLFLSDGAGNGCHGQRFNPWFRHVVGVYAYVLGSGMECMMHVALFLCVLLNETAWQALAAWCSFLKLGGVNGR
jgi:hypothetical protein